VTTFEPGAPAFEEVAAALFMYVPHPAAVVVAVTTMGIVAPAGTPEYAHVRSCVVPSTLQPPVLTCHVKTLGSESVTPTVNASVVPALETRISSVATSPAVTSGGAGISVSVSTGTARAPRPWPRNR
jgi:hypothetical protein